jgi:hypothetical protein
MSGSCNRRSQVAPKGRSRTERRRVAAAAPGVSHRPATGKSCRYRDQRHSTHNRHGIMRPHRRPFLRPYNNTKLLRVLDFDWLFDLHVDCAIKEQRAEFQFPSEPVSRRVEFEGSESGRVRAFRGIANHRFAKPTPPLPEAAKYLISGFVSASRAP